MEDSGAKVLGELAIGVDLLSDDKACDLLAGALANKQMFFLRFGQGRTQQTENMNVSTVLSELRLRHLLVPADKSNLSGCQ